MKFHTKKNVTSINDYLKKWNEYYDFGRFKITSGRITTFNIAFYI